MRFKFVKFSNLIVVFQIVLLFFFQLFYILPCYILHLLRPTVSLLHNLHHEIKLFYINLYSIVVINYTFSSLYPADDCHAYGKYFIFCISMAFTLLSLCCGFEVRIKILLNLMYFLGVKFTPKNYCELGGLNRFNYLSYMDSFYAF